MVIHKERNRTVHAFMLGSSIAHRKRTLDLKNDKETYKTRTRKKEECVLIVFLFFTCVLIPFYSFGVLLLWLHSIAERSCCFGSLIETHGSDVDVQVRESVSFISSQFCPNRAKWSLISGDTLGGSRPPYPCSVALFNLLFTSLVKFCLRNL